MRPGFVKVISRKERRHFMKKDPLSRFLLVLPLSLTAAWAQQKAEPQHTQFQLVSKQTVEVGELPSYAVKTVPFRFKNKGEKVANINGLISTCPCISATADKMVIQPNEEAVVTLRLDASKVHDAFRRGVWIETNDAENPRLLLSVSGVIRPLFSGLPPMPIRIVSSGKGNVLTNTYTVTATETNLFLGPPVIATNGEIRLVVSVTTNTAQEKAVYTIQTVLTALGSGKSAASASLPIEGRPNQNFRPLTLLFQSVAGATLRVAPSRIMISPASRLLSRQLRVATSEKNADPAALTWAPQIEGVSVQVSPTLMKSSLSVTLSFTPESVEKLTDGKQAKITFSYPNHKPASVEFTRGGKRGALPPLP